MPTRYTSTRSPPKPPTRRAMLARRTETKATESYGKSEPEIRRLTDENEALRLQNERLMERLYPKRAAAVFHLAPLSHTFPWKSLLFVLCLLGFCIPAYAHVYFSCGASSHGFALAVPKQITCVPPSVGNVANCFIELWIPRTDPIKASAIKCQIHVRTVCTHTGFFGSRGIVSDTKDLRTVPLNVCRAADFAPTL